MCNKYKNNIHQFTFKKSRFYETKVLFEQIFSTSKEFIF